MFRRRRILADDTLQQLENNDESLNFFNYAFDEETSSRVAAALRTNTSVTMFSVSAAQSSESLNEILAALQNNVIVTNLTLSMPFSMVNAPAIAALLRSNTTLCALNISFVSFQPHTGEDIGTALAVNTSLVSLTADFMFMNNDGHQFEIMLDRGMRANTTITELSINHNRFTKFETITRILESNTTLQTLKMSSLNNIQYDAQDTSEFIRAIRINTTLTQLNLKDGLRTLDEQETLDFVQAIQTNSTLLSLDLSQNGFDSNTGRAIANALVMNSTLTQLNLSDMSDMSDMSVAEALSNALDTNTTLCRLEFSTDNMEWTKVQEIYSKMQGREYMEPVSVKTVVAAPRGVKRPASNLHLLLL